MPAASRFLRWILSIVALVVSAHFTPSQAAAVVLPGAGKVNQVDFERHIMGLFGRLGCNSGSCHGSFQGKGGFRLSLFGYDPEKDFFALTRDAMGRRVNPLEADLSLLLLKPTAQIAHEGGKKLAKDSWQYQLFRAWILAGAPWKKGSGEVAGIRITPEEYHFSKVGEAGQLQVKARFTDGSEEDITPFCDFRINDDSIAEVGSLGQVKSVRPGDTAVVVSYRGNVLPVRVLVPVKAPAGFQYPQVPEFNYIDREVLTKLRRLNIVPSNLSTDQEFLRRVTIDTIGCLPSPDEIRAFVANSDPEKRSKKIDELLAHPMHAALWATKFCDITGNNTDALELPREKRSKMWHDWFRKRLAENRPYDEIIRDVLCATSRDGKAAGDWVKETRVIDESALQGFESAYAERPSLDLFWRRQQANVPIEQWGEKTAAAFMGIRLECAQCHKHPFDRWTQHDYRAHANIFGQVKYDPNNPDTRTAINEENVERRKGIATAKNRNQALQPLRELYLTNRPASLPNPDTNGALPPKALGGPEIPIKDGADARVALFQWLQAPDNPFFARSFVNRVWGHYLGIGIVDPVDDFSLANPPSNPHLLNALAKDFVEHKFDIRHMERTILNSRVYQLSSIPNESNKLDRNNYSHSQARRMMAEVVLDVLNTALGVAEEWGNGPDVPPNSRAIEVAPSRIANNNLAYLFRIFGRSPRTQACDCERSLEPALPQTLFLMTDNGLQRKLERSRVRQLIAGKQSDEEVLDELFLATLSRLPTAEEKSTFLSYKGTRTDRQSLFTDTLWALINTREFILNH